MAYWFVGLAFVMAIGYTQYCRLESGWKTSRPRMCAMGGWPGILVYVGVSLPFPISGSTNFMSSYHLLQYLRRRLSSLPFPKDQNPNTRTHPDLRRLCSERLRRSILHDQQSAIYHTWLRKD